MSDPRLTAIRDSVQVDAGNRGLRADPIDNLITRTIGDFEAACRSLAVLHRAHLAIVTGFTIPTAEPPACETDGPLGAVFLARALVPAGIGVTIVTDPNAHGAVLIGLEGCGLEEWVPVLRLPSDEAGHTELRTRLNDVTHLLALERVGPSHADGRCYSMRGRDITDSMRPAEWLFTARAPGIVTLGIGDGGNEIGMGKVPRAVIARCIPNGDQVACRVATDQLIVAGVSNWGAYGLAAGVRLLGGVRHDPHLFDPNREHDLLRLMVEQGGLVDGVTSRREATVDGMQFERSGEVLRQIGAMVAGERGA